MNGRRTHISDWFAERIAEPGAWTIAVAALSAIGLCYILLASMGVMGIVGLADYQGLLLLVVPSILLGGFLAWLNERVWIYVALAGHFVMYMSARNVGVAGGEIAFTALSLAGICIWLFKEMAIHRRPIVRTGFDALLLGVFISTSVVALVATLLHDGEMMRYMNEWTKLLDLLLYFPVRAIIRTRRDVMVLVGICVLIGVVNGVFSVMTYRERLMDAVFAYEIEHSRVFTNEPVSMIYAILGTVVVAYARTRWTLLLGILLTTSGILFLIVTFSRGAILSATIGMTFVMLFSGRGLRVLSVIIVSLVMGATAVYVAFPNIATTMATSVGRRLGSIGSTMTDVSFNLRVIEANKILEYYVPHSPIIGYGYGVRYHWIDPTVKYSINHSFIHNGYIRLVYKYGYPLAVFFLFFLLYPLLRAMMSWPSRLDWQSHAMMVGSIAYLICALVNNYVSDMFSHFAGPFNYVLCWAVLDYVHRRTSPLSLPQATRQIPPEPLVAVGA